MKYTIRRESDINEGVLLYVEIPVDQVDRDALYTIEADMPDFIVPFTYRTVDDVIECCYRVGNRSLLRYFPGEKNTAEYCDLFMQLISPLRNCGNWFMQPLSFVLDFDHIYYDFAAQKISYLYIPSKEPYSSDNTVYEMTKRVCKEFPVRNSDLQIKVLNALVDNFNLRSFYQIIKEASSAVQQVNDVPNVVKEAPVYKVESLPQIETIPVAVHVPVEESPVPEQQIPVFVEQNEPTVPDMAEDDLEIRFDFEQPVKDKKNKKEKKVKKEKKEKKEKPVKAPEEKTGGLFQGLFAGKEKSKQKAADLPVAKQEQIIVGASAEMVTPFVPPVEPEIPAVHYTPDYEHTVIQKPISENVPRLVCVGDRTLPEIIEIRVTQGKIFKIGRYDVTLKRKQSDFEFPSETKAVSRHHAVIEVENGEYFITDIGSLVGTYVNGERLQVSVPCQLLPEAKVSFGNAGADYVFKK